MRALPGRERVFTRAGTPRFSETIHYHRSGKWRRGGLVLHHVRVAQALANGRARAVGFAASNRISAIIRGVEGARAVVARQADPTERRVRRRAVGWLVPVD